jgi:hypothetical protein
MVGRLAGGRRCEDRVIRFDPTTERRDQPAAVADRILVFIRGDLPTPCEQG